MFRRTTILILFVLLAVVSARDLSAQEKAPSKVDDLIKSIGLSKPAQFKAPDFTLRDVGGASVSLSGYRGGLVLLNFWTTWCVPCRDEMPSMENLSRNFGGQGFTILAVNQKESAAQVGRFMKTQGLNFLTPLDSDGRVSNAYRVHGIPVSYVIDGAGNAIGMKSGASDWSSRDVVDVFRTLIGTGGTTTNSLAGAMDLEPAKPMPRALRAKGNGMLLRAQQDGASEVVARVPSSEEVAPLGKVSGAGDFWYMVKTKSGAVGWVRGAEVEEIIRGK